MNIVLGILTMNSATHNRHIYLPGEAILISIADNWLKRKTTTFCQIVKGSRLYVIIKMLYLNRFCY